MEQLGHVQVRARPHPFKDEWFDVEAQPFQSVASLVGGTDAHALVWVEGDLLHPNVWETTVLEPEQHVTVCAVPQGPLSAIGAIKILGTALTVGAVANFVFFNVVVPLALGAVLNALIPPPDQPKGDTQGIRRYESITGLRNRVVPFGTVPKLYGRMKYFPPIPMTAPAFTEIKGSDQYVRIYFVLGYGPMDIGGVRADSSTLLKYSSQELPASLVWHKVDGDPPTNTSEMDALMDGELQTTNIFDLFLFINQQKSDTASFTDRIYWSQDQNAKAPDAKPSTLPADEYAVRFEGTFFAPEDGEYTFGLNSQESADLFVNDTLVVSRYSAPDWSASPTIGTITLSKGLNNFRLRLVTVDGENQEGVALYWQKPSDSALEVIPAANLNRTLIANEALGANIFIGDTAIENIEDIQVEVGDPDQVSLYSDQVFEQNPGVVMEMQNKGVGAEKDYIILNDDVSVTRTTEADTDEISIDVGFPNALYSSSERGNRNWVMVEFKIEISPAGAGTWVTVEPSWRIKTSTKKAFRRNRTFTVSRGQYDVRLTRARTQLARTTSFSADATYDSLRSIRKNRQPFKMDDVVVMTMLLKATEQFNGNIDQIAVLGTSILPVWTGTAWEEKVTRLPAWSYVDIHCGTANERPMSKDDVDVDAIKSWADWQEAEGIHYDNVFDADGTVFDRAREVAGTGRGAWQVLDDGTLSVTRDVAQSMPTMIITPRNSRNFTMERGFYQIPHALRVGFVDPDTFKDVERLVFDDGYTEANATRFETLQTRGVTSADQAWKEGRFHLAQMRLRPERYSWQMGIQNLVFRRGDTVRVVDDVIRVGLAAGRILEVVEDANGHVTSFRSDETLFMESGLDYAVRINSINGGLAEAGQISDDGVIGIEKPTSTVLLVTIANANPSTEWVELDTPVVGVEVGDHFLFGEATRESLEAKVVSIQFEDGFKEASISAVPAAPEILDAPTGTIPAFDPNINIAADPSTLPPPVPVITSVDSSINARPTDEERIPIPRVVVGFRLPSNFGLASGVEIRYRDQGTTDDAWIKAGPVDPSESAVVLNDIDRTQLTLEIQARSLRGNLASKWSATTLHTVEEVLPTHHKATTFFQATEPPASQVTGIGDLWFDTDDDNRPRRWDGSAWVEARDLKVNAAFSLADSKIVTFFQDEPPTAESVGDIWFDTNDGNKPYRWSGAAWVAAQDGDAVQALQDAANAQSTADGKIVTFFQDTAPTGQTVGDIWFDTNDQNKPYRWDGTSWVEARDAKALEALQTAETKVTTFFQPSQPTAEAVGDLWVDTDDGNKTYRWNGTTWDEASILVEFDETDSGAISTQLFDGTDDGVWKEIATTTVQVTADNRPQTIRGSFNISVDQLSSETLQAGPGGPEIQVRVVRDKGLAGEAVVELMSPIAVTTSGEVTVQMDSQTDMGALAGARTYTFEAKWEKTTYSGGTIAVDWDSGTSSFYTLTGTGTFWGSNVNRYWEIRIPDYESGTAIWVDLAKTVTAEVALLPEHNTKMLFKDTAKDGTANVWPDSDLPAGTTYEMRDPEQALVATLTFWWLRITEQAG